MLRNHSQIMCLFLVCYVQRCLGTEFSKHRYFAMCILCKGSYRSCAFLPCCHILFCWNCGQHFRRCDECQLEVDRRMHVRLGRSSQYKWLGTIFLWCWLKVLTDGCLNCSFNNNWTKAMIIYIDHDHDLCWFGKNNPSLSI